MEEGDHVPDLTALGMAEPAIEPPLTAGWAQ